MNTLFLKRVLFGSVLLAMSAAASVAQNQPDAELPPAKPADVRANALKQLGLSRAQMFEIRKINQARRPQMDEAQDRLRRANRALDESIYSDSVSEEAFQARLREFQAAQAEVARIRFVNELAVRRILNPEQVGKFRQIRERFERARQARDAGLRDRRPMPMTKLKRSLPVSNK